MSRAVKSVKGAILSENQNIGKPSKRSLVDGEQPENKENTECDRQR